MPHLTGCSTLDEHRSPALLLETLELRTLFATVSAVDETTPVPNGGDSADDVAIWVHPTNPSQSTILGTDKDSDGGIAVYDLSGNQLGFFQHGAMNNVDVRYGFRLGGQTVDIAVASNRSSGGSLAVYKVNPSTRLLENIAARTLETGMSDNVYGVALYKSPVSGKLYAFMTSRSGGYVEQWELYDNGAGRVDGRIVRTFDVGNTSEAMVVDDQTQSLYIGEESRGIWRYGAEPTAGTARTSIDTTGSGGHLTADVEGLAIYRGANGAGYLLASSQGSDDFTVYQRGGNHAYLGRFEIGSSATVDSVSRADGIEVMSYGLGGAFASGLFVTQDNLNPGGNQNFKLVPWSSIAGAMSLQINTSQNPRGGSTPLPPSPPPQQPPTTPTTININFQPANAPVPSGYRVDSGAAFGARGGGLSYGWNVDNTGYARDRNFSISPDQRYDTLNHMQQPNRPGDAGFRWEIAVPNGTYRVTLVAGDPRYYTDSLYRINVEGALTINAAPSSSARWFQATRTVTISDGRLTISNASGAINNRINFLQLTRV